MKRLVLVKFFKGYIFREPFLGNRFLGGRELLKLLVCIDLRMLKFLCSWKITFTSKSNLNNGQRFSEAKINQSFIITFSENFVYLRVRLLLSNLFYHGLLLFFLLTFPRFCAAFVLQCIFNSVSFDRRSYFTRLYNKNNTLWH